MEALTTAEGIAALITGGVAIIGTVSATLHKLGIVTLRSPLKVRSNGRGAAENPGNPAPPDVPQWYLTIREGCISQFGAINTTLQRIEGSQGDQVTHLGSLKTEVAQLVSAYRESNGQAGIVVENLKGRVADLEKVRDGYTDE